MCRYEILAQSQSMWALQFGEPGRFPAPRLTKVYRKPSTGVPKLTMCAANPVQGYVTDKKTHPPRTLS